MAPQLARRRDHRRHGLARRRRRRLRFCTRFVSDFSAVYLPTTSNQCCTEYSVIFTFALLAFVLALRPLGLFGRPA